MSEYTTIESAYKDKDVIIATAKELGFQCEVGENLNLYGYRGDKRKQVADIVIRRQFIGAASNDIGFTKRADGKYDLTISEYDRQTEKGTKMMEEFPKLYASNVTLKELKKKGYKLKKRVVEQDGTIELRFFS